jgi:hypothetical protein
MDEKISHVCLKKCKVKDLTLAHTLSRHAIKMWGVAKQSLCTVMYFK